MKKRESDLGKLALIRVIRGSFLLLFLVAAISAITSCGTTMTVAPKPAQAHVVSNWAAENILDANKSGVLVTPEYVRVYHDLLATYGSKLPVSSRPPSPDDGIAAEGKNFRVSYQVGDRFADLKYFERNNE